MRFLLALLMVLVLPAGVFAQEGEQAQVREPLGERVTVKGRIVNERGEAVEYVQVGVPRRWTGGLR